MIKKLGGSWRDAYLKNRAEASMVITALQDAATAEFFKVPGALPLDHDAWESFPQERAYRRGELPPEWKFFDSNGNLDPGDVTAADREGDDDEDEEPAVATSSTRLAAMGPLLKKIPAGYYAAEDDTGVLRFIRISYPTKHRYAGAMKVQTVSGNNLWGAWTWWPSGRMSVHETNFDVEKILLDLIIPAANRKAARAYAKEIGRCARCNARLTDPRSRHYGIGPECEKHWPWYIAEIDMLDAAAKEEADA